MGILEGEEKGRPTEFIAGLIPKLFGASNFTKPVMVDRAHRIPVPKPMDANRPRSIIARIRFYQEKELIIRLSQQQQVNYNGNQVYVYPDYTVEVTAQRRGFREIIQALREREVQNTLCFPAKLHVPYNDQVKVFTSPGDVKSFIEQELKKK